MSRVIQLLSHNQHLFALTDAGEIFATPSVLNAKWSLFEGPPLSSPSYSQASVSGESFVTQNPVRRPTTIGSDGNYIPSAGY